MGRKSVRIYLADMNTLVHSGIKSVMPDVSVLETKIFEDLIIKVAMDRGLAHLYKDIIVLGRCRSIRNLDFIDMITYLTKTFDLPLLLIGNIEQGWFINYILNTFGARGYLHQQDNLCQALPKAIQAVSKNRNFNSPYTKFLIKEAHETGLTQRLFSSDELNVVRLLCQGIEESDIAKRLNVPQRRIYAIICRMKSLFGADNTEALAAQATACGLLAI